MRKVEKEQRRTDCVDLKSLKCMQRNLQWLSRSVDLSADRRGRIVASWRTSWRDGAKVDVTFLPSGSVSYAVLRDVGGCSGVAADMGEMFQWV
jgi:hypothetical protein